MYTYVDVHAHMCIHTGYVPFSEKRIMCPAPCDFQVSSQVIILDKDSVWRYVDASELPKCYKDPMVYPGWSDGFPHFSMAGFVSPKTGERNFQPRNNLMHCDWHCWRNMVGFGPWRLPWLMICGWCGEGFHPFAWLMIWTHSHVVDGAKCGQNAESHPTLHEHSANNLCLYFSDPFASLQHLQMDFFSQLNQKCSLEECCNS